MGCTDFPFGGEPRPGCTPLTEATVREFLKPTRAEIARLRIRIFLTAWDFVESDELPTTLTRLTLDGVEFDVTVDDLRALVGDLFGPAI